MVFTTKSCLLILQKARSSSVLVLAKTFVIKLAYLANLPEAKQHDVPFRELICRMSEVNIRLAYRNFRS